MNPEKNYYSVLGVLPDAEDIVIKAAYRALAQRYHPDRFGGSKEQAHAYMSKLNEAYGVLSDKDKRRTYDQLYGTQMAPGGSALSAIEEAAPPGEDPMKKDWRIALKYYPDLATLEGRLAQFSWKLANTYRAYLLEIKQFESREWLARLMENHFLSAYFGDNEKTMDFARRLIINSQREAAVTLNDTIRVLGINTDPRRIIGKIARDFNIRHLAVNREEIHSLLPKTREATAHTALLVQLLRELGGIVVPNTGNNPLDRATAAKSCKVEFDGREFNFPSEDEFRSWFRREVLPKAEELAQ